VIIVVVWDACYFVHTAVNPVEGQLVNFTNNDAWILRNFSKLFSKETFEIFLLKFHLTVVIENKLLIKACFYSIKVLVLPTLEHNIHEAELVFNRKTKKLESKKIHFQRQKKIKWKSCVTFFGTLQRRFHSHSSTLFLSPFLPFSLILFPLSLSLRIRSFVMIFRKFS